ncbi:uncharacterized protein EDB93DRAFT_694009 [Suillus bovinus]|uniref:uncharacterized protein n=1 Tax=Suillus bovinus TaxID=48563 RepID=UPI001B86898C|nr:uncharacterized protein EDB93DRAFT_694009 [Suillus bovinus]KAG2139856.1 hypothetical protein EDB93DRAFT_694009 [Suillus bovinus]
MLPMIMKLRGLSLFCTWQSIVTVFTLLTYHFAYCFRYSSAVIAKHSYALMAFFWLSALPLSPVVVPTTRNVFCLCSQLALKSSAVINFPSEAKVMSGPGQCFTEAHLSQAAWASLVYHESQEPGLL